VVELGVVPGIAHRQQVAIEREHLGLGEQSRQHDRDYAAAGADVENRARGHHVDRAQEQVGSFVHLMRGKQGVCDVERERLTAAIIVDPLLKVDIYARCRHYHN
jgi:hypothetical protein